MAFAVILAISAAMAIPMTFFSVALPALMREAGVPLSMIGLTGLVYLPFALVFLWAPLVDRYSLGSLGYRRSWIVLLQIGIAICIAAMAFVSPRDGVVAVLCVGVLVATLGATLRTAFLGFVTETLKPGQRPWGGAMIPAGGALGALIGASGLLFLYGSMGWAMTMFAMAILLVFSLAPVLLTREPEQVRSRHASAARPSLRAVVRRREIWTVVTFLIPLAFGLGLGFGMLQPRLVDLGYTMEELGLINGLFTCAAMFTGGPLAAFLVGRFGLASILPLGVLGMATILLYSAVTSIWQFGETHAAAALVLFFLGFSFIGVMTNTIFMSQSAGTQAGTDFTVFICIYWFLSMLGMGLSGIIAEHLGYGAAFLSGGIAVALSLPLIHRLPLGALPEELPEEEPA